MEQRRTLTKRGLMPASPVEDETAALHRIDDSRRQACCERCLRSSPVIQGDMRNAFTCVVDLGWRIARRPSRAGLGAWTCPVCQARDAGRYALGTHPMSER